MKDYTEIVFILDRSGSMQGLESDTIGGFNSVLKKNKKEEGDAVVSTILFDDVSEVICNRENIKNVKPITEKQYYVRGCTALLDAVGGAIDHVAKTQKILPKSHRAKNVLFVITTDGYENASHRYTYADVKKKIEKKKEKGWDFIFMGANIDAAAEAARIGISADRAALYHADGPGTQAVFKSVAKVVLEERANACISDGWRDAIDEDEASRS